MHIYLYCITGSYARARNNVKSLERGEEAADDKTTDYEKPRRKRKPRRLVEDDEETPQKKARTPQLGKIDSDSDGSGKEASSPKLQNLEDKLAKVIARREVKPRLPSHSKPIKEKVQVTVQVNKSALVSKPACESKSKSQEKIQVPVKLKILSEQTGSSSKPKPKGIQLVPPKNSNIPTTPLVNYGMPYFRVNLL